MAKDFLTWEERFELMDRRVQFLEDQLGISYSKNPKKRGNHTTFPEQEPEETINGFTKAQLRVMFSWAKNTKLQLISKGDFEELQRWNMLKDFYPDAPDKYEDIKL